MNNMAHNKIMIDIETLGVSPISIITEIGLTFFSNDSIGQSYLFLLPIKPQIELGFEVNEETLKFRVLEFIKLGFEAAQDKEGVLQNLFTDDNSSYIIDANYKNYLKLIKTHLLKQYDDTSKIQVSDNFEELYQLRDLLSDSKVSEIWCNGLDFDIPLIKNLFSVLNFDNPIEDFWKVRDLRTLKKFFYPSGKIPVKDEPFQHYSISDNYYQIKQLQYIIKNNKDA